METLKNVLFFGFVSLALAGMLFSQLPSFDQNDNTRLDSGMSGLWGFDPSEAKWVPSNPNLMGGFDGLAYQVETGAINDKTIERIVFYDAAVPPDVWSPINPPSYTLWEDLSAQQTLFVNAFATEDQGGSTGALSVYIEGVDDNYALTFETLSMTGVDTETVNEYLHVNKFMISSVGSDRINQGVVWLSRIASVDGWPAAGNIMSAILTEEGAAAYGRYAVPADKTAYLIDYRLVSGEDANTAKTALRIRFGNDSDEPFISCKTSLMYRNSVMLNPYSKVVPEKSVIEVWAEGEGGSGSVSGCLMLILIDN